MSMNINSRPPPSMTTNATASRGVESPAIESKNIADVQQPLAEKRNLFQADSFDKGGLGKVGEAGGKQELLKKLEDVIQSLNKLVELLSGKKAGGEQGGPGKAGGAHGAGGGHGAGGAGGAPAAGGAQAPSAPSAPAEAGDAQKPSSPIEMLQKLTKAIKEVVDLLSSGDTQKIAQAGQALDKLSAELGSAGVSSKPQEEELNVPTL